MFGHQDEPQQPHNSQFAVPDPSADNALDAGLNDIVTSTAPSVPLPPSAPSAGAPITDVVPAQSATDGDTPELTALASTSIDANKLLDIKQQALQALSPLVSHLEQSPEEKFRTTMMMIQASDNQDLIATAYGAAQAITDEKAKAQALLDLVNEINYFTQHQSK